MNCRICNNERDNRAIRARETMFGTGDEFDYFECAKCGCIQIATIPSPEEMARYYPSNYYSYEPAQLKRGVHGAIARIRNRAAATGSGLIGRMLCSLYPFPEMQSLGRIRAHRHVKILDVGCGSGELLRALRHAGFDHLLGADPFIAEQIDYDQGLSILKSDVSGVPDGWDVIMFHHSFEHIPTPEATLRTAAAKLVPGGHCILRIPTSSSEAWKRYGTDWIQFDAPRHFFLHSVDSIRILGEQTGLELTNVVYDSTAFQFWGSEQCRQGIALRDPASYRENPSASPFSPEDIRKFAQEAAQLNAEHRGDQAAFYLRKPLN